MEVSSNLHASGVLPAGENPPQPVPIVCVVEWTPEPVLALWQGDKFSAPAGK